MSPPAGAAGFRLWAGAFLLFLIVVLGPWVKQIPMPALVAVMVMVSINTFHWRSLRTLVTHPKSSERGDAGHRRGGAGDA